MEYSNIEAEDLEVGLNTVIHPSASIRGINGKAKKISIGDNCYIGADVQIIIDEFSLGDYSKIQHHCNIHGYKPCHIGHNAWIGQYTIIDSIGGVTIGDNCGIGAHSQLWSHIKYGDTLEGCNFLSEKEMKVGKDVWFVGHCIVSPITAEDKSLLLAGSVITIDMKSNCVYGGSPAKDLTDKIGPQFSNVSLQEKKEKMNQHLKDSGVSPDKVKIVLTEDEVNFEDESCSYFILSTRQYTKRRTEEEIQFMKYLLPEKAKFTPR